MKGNNVLTLCQGEMIRAIEYYLNTIQFKEPVQVVSVSEDRSKNNFSIIIEEVKKDKE